jgi:subtilisin family serine protease
MPKKNPGRTGQQTREGYLSSVFETPDVPDYVIVELKYESPVAFGTAGFAAPAASKSQASALNRVLGKYDVARVRSHFGKKHEEVKARIVRAASLPKAPSAAVLEDKGLDADFIQSGFVQIVPKKSSDAPKLARELNRHGAVWQAYVAPRPVPADMATGTSGGSRNFEPAQGYLHSAPNGIGAMEAWPLAGGKGQGVTICDLEGNWNRAHEDLPSGIPLIGGTVIADIGWRNHGTAVLGEMVSRPGDAGTVGIAHEALAKVHAVVIGGVFNTAGAIAGATAELKAGDVILIELQANGPNNKYVAMQYWDDVFSAIVSATAKGITVVEAAGNGNENFGLAIFNGTGLRKDSGAIVVGAGIPPTNYLDISGFDKIGVPRSRIWFSNYGKIVNVHAWGWNVTTCGYGDAQGGASENRWYTHRFSGTSSASPIVTGAVACLQGIAKSKNGAPLSPARVRQLLIKTGTPQRAGPGVPLSQHIGPLPNLEQAAKLV